ncbi:MAG: iron-containing alcohol dehydrogenase [Micrococcales bacterium]
MSFRDVSDPTDLKRIKQVIAAAPEPERLVSLDIKHMEISWSASEQTVPIAAELLVAAGVEPVGARVVLLTDEVEILKGQLNFKNVIFEKLSKYFNVTWVKLAAEGVVKVDEKTLETATSAVEGFDLIVGLGGGTISDIAKVASDRQHGIPVISIQTAASVDGYTDNVSVVLKNGAKRTIDSRWPDAVIADLEVIQSAPLELNLAGFGEALSLFTAPADWKLAHEVGLDSSFHETPRDLLLTFAGNPALWGVGLSDGQLGAVEQLTKVLAIRGIGTGIAGTTACLSGVEHLISHMLDMRAVADHQNVGLHGAQVGVASLVGAMAWKYLADNIEDINLPEQVNSAAVETAVRDAFSQIDATGTLTAECISDVHKKVAKFNENIQRASELLASFKSNPARLAELLPDPAALAEGLKKSGAARSIDELENWIDQDIWTWAVANCHLMRNRFTVVDLLYFAGRWNASDVAQVIEMADNAVERVRL